MHAAKSTCAPLLKESSHVPETRSPEERRSYSTAHVAKRMGVSIPTVQRWVDAGQLLAWKTLGGHRRIDADSADALISRHSSAAMAPAPAETISVVIVDDNPDDRDLLAALVDEALPGASVTIADNGFVGLVAIGKTQADLVITDIQMPHMDGIEMLRQLCSNEGLSPRALVAVTSLTPRQLAQRGELPEAVQYVRKPVTDPEAFIQMLRTAVGGANLHQSVPPAGAGS
jgi:excisionase family DNA binding protein